MTFQDKMKQDGVKVLQDDFILWRTCRRKTRYNTLERAEAVLARIRGSEMHAYPCPYCSGFHIGHPRHND